MSQVFALLAVALMVLAFLAVTLVAFGAIAAPKGSRFDEKYFTNLTVVDHEGKSYRFYDDLIKNKQVVINFIYLNCNDICPLTTSRVAEVRDRLGDVVGKKVYIYSITMDPERDTPEKLKEFGEAFGVGKGWKFITGKPEVIHKLRHSLGERSRKLSEHRHDMVIGNEPTGEWSRTSLYSDFDVIVHDIRSLDPVWRNKRRDFKTQRAKKRRYVLSQQPGQALFIKACSTCHKIGGGEFYGPDLKDVTKRRSREWLVEFLLAPDRMRKERDPIVIGLVSKYKGLRMPNLGLKEADISDLLKYIESAPTRKKASGTQQ